MSIDILIVDAPIDRLNKLATLFKGHCYWFKATTGKQPLIKIHPPIPTYRKMI